MFLWLMRCLENMPDLLDHWKSASARVLGKITTPIHLTYLVHYKKHYFIQDIVINNKNDN